MKIIYKYLPFTKGKWGIPSFLRNIHHHFYKDFSYVLFKTLEICHCAHLVPKLSVSTSLFSLTNQWFLQASPRAAHLLDKLADSHSLTVHRWIISSSLLRNHTSVFSNFLDITPESFMSLQFNRQNLNSQLFLPLALVFFFTEDYY